VAAALLGIAALFALPAAASAEPGPTRMVSQTPAEQAQEATEPALSADGRFLAFQGTIGGLKGVFREDLSSGAIVPVAVGPVTGGGADTPVDANAPSISVDGRYVSFTTKASLNPDDVNGFSDVYVADMSTTPPTYELASALDGCDPVTQSACGLIYGGVEGSQSSGRVALSADGRKVVFVVNGESNLGGTEGDTPAGQVVLRDLTTDRTTLVSVVRDPETGAMTGQPVPGGAEVVNPQQKRLQGAALSADGTTVAWLGANVPAQVPTLTDERDAIAKIEASKDVQYDEPLWRRVADGPQAPTRAIVGAGDPLAPGCPPTGTLAEAACQGPYPGIIVRKGDQLVPGTAGWMGPKGVDGVPQLSADGRTVALIGNPIGAANVYLVNMESGRSRKQAVHELTREIQVNTADPTTGFTPANIPLNGHVFDLAISPDGSRIAFATARQRFPLAPPNLIGSPPAQLGVVELYMIDLDGETLRRLTHGDGGVNEASLVPGEPNPTAGQGATSPSFGAGGHLIAFASDASNLVPGDGNDASDAFVVEDGEASRAPAGSSISPGPRRPRLKRSKGMALSAASLPDGAVRLLAVVPGAGSLRARAKGALAVGAPLRPLALARGRARGSAGGVVKVTLRLPRRLRRLAHSREGLYAIARVSFHRRRGKVLHGEIQVRFHAHPKRGGGR
jgi:Tol biopolymer transport system component